MKTMEMPRLGYGTTALVSRATPSERLRLLEKALEEGITHFDTAPYYGYGEAERVLGGFLRGKRDQVTLTTKFGIEPPAAVSNPLVNRVARRVLGWFPALRGVLSRKAQGMSRRGAFSVESARRSLERSLSALQTDVIDLLLLHEPTEADASSPEILAFLEGEVRRGSIRAYGCGGDFREMEKILACPRRDGSSLRTTSFPGPSGASAKPPASPSGRSRGGCRLSEPSWPPAPG
jgi:D-threo-aldose 1-dehydrogenase